MRAVLLLALVSISACNLFGPPPPATCSRASDCGDNERCRSGACEAVVPDCTVDGDCNSDEFCERSECVECIDDRDCTGADVCDDNECVAGTDGEGEGGDGEGEGGDGEGEGSDGEGEAPPPPPPVEGGPRILSMSANQTTITEDQSVIVSVIVTDPQGIDDVIGGTLIDPSNNASFGTFATSAAEGAYQIELTWSAINMVRVISFTAPQTRTLRARFFDVAGNESFADLSITLSCQGEPACNGSCAAIDCGGSCVFSLSSLEQCGACGVSCGNAGVCQGGSPLLGYGAQCSCEPVPGRTDFCGDSCVELFESPNCGSCGRTCTLDCGFSGSQDVPSCTCLTTNDCDPSSLCDVGERQCIEASNLRLDAGNRAVMTLNGQTKFLCEVPPNVGEVLCNGAVATVTSENVDRDQGAMVAGVVCPVGFTDVAECQVDSLRFSCVYAQVVTCDGAPPPPPPPPTLGIRQTNGFLEVDLGSGFGQVCDDNFNTAEAIVACRQLGTPDATPTFTTVNAATATFIMDEVDCSGSEATLAACTFDSAEDCGTTEGVRVSCN